MPRLHLGSNDGRRRGGRAVAAAAGGTSSAPRRSSSGPAAGGGSDGAARNDGVVVDAGTTNGGAIAGVGGRAASGFDYDEFDLDFDESNDSGDTGGNGGGIGAGGGGESRPPAAPAAGAAKTQSSSPPLPSSSNKCGRKMAVYDSSSSSSSDSDDEMLGLSRKSPAAAGKKKSSIGSGIGGGISKAKNGSGIGASATGGGAARRARPTHSSPRITVSDLSKTKKPAANANNAGGNAGKGANKGGKAGPKGKKQLGKPVNNKAANKPAKKSSKGKGKNDENTENQSSKRKKAPAGVQKRRGKGGKQQARRGYAKLALSDSSDSSSSEEEEEEEVAPKKRQRRQQQNGAKKGGGKKNARRQARYGTAHLVDTDDENSGEDDEVMVVEKTATKERRSDRTKRAKVSLDGDSHGRELVDVGGSGRAQKQQHQKQQKQRGEQFGRQDGKIQVLPLRILAVDNRALPTPMGDSAARSSFLGYLPQLIEDGLERGVLSSFSGVEEGSATLVASLVRGAKSTQLDKAKVARRGGFGALVKTSVVPRVSCLFEGEDGGVLGRDREMKWVSDFVAPVNQGFEGSGGDADDAGVEGRSVSFDYGTDGPISGEALKRGFSAGDSWGYFGDLVEAIEHKISFSSNPPHNARPITLFTTDANLFCAETKSAAHTYALDRFWKRISSAFRTNAASSVAIVVVETTGAMQAMKTATSYDDGMDENSLDATLLPDRLRVVQCVNDVRGRIRELNRAQDLDSTPVDLRLEFVEGNAVSFNSLLQTWVREGFAQTYSSCTADGGVQGRLSFDLPETLDGIMCSVSLDLQCTVLPRSLHSPETAALVKDMQQISKLSSVEVVQTIPLSSVDSSLIYGVPMSARAGLENDISRYTEMKVLSRQLWKYLSRNDVGLVLRARIEADDASDEGRPGEQLFLLVSEAAVEKPKPQALDPESQMDPSEALNIVPAKGQRGEAPCHGVLYRYATKSQILRFGSEEEKRPHEAGEADEETATVSEQYFDYIERSLEGTITSGLNPFLMNIRN